MAKALFFGNSHVAAYKLAHRRLGAALPYACAFYCAQALDPAFVELRGLELTPVGRIAIEPDELQVFCPDGARSEIEHYLGARTPLNDVAAQFRRTGGSDAVDLSEVTEIFYVAGTSPYDFRRLGEFIFPVSDALRRELLGRLLRDRYLLRRQIADIRAAAPHIRHHFIGAPLRKWPPAALPADVMEVLQHNRSTISRLAGDYLFDAVFMPGPGVLADDLVSTRPEFFRGGYGQAQDVLGLTEATEDILHVNPDYAAVVFDAFVTPLVTRRLRPA